MSDHELSAPLRDGFGEPWPITHADLAPAYDAIERYMEVTGSPEHVERLPGGHLGPVVRLSASEAKIDARMRARWPDRRLLPGRSMLAPISRPFDAAMRTGNLTVLPDTLVARLLLGNGGREVRSVAVVDRVSGRAYELTAKAVVLCASTIESLRILLSSKTPEHPTGVGDPGDVLGHYLMDHISNPSLAFGLGFDGDHDAGADLAGHCYIPTFRNVGTETSAFLRGYSLIGQVGRDPVDAPSTLRFWSMGEVLPRATNFVEIDPTGRDPWDVPVARVHLTYSDNEREMARDQAGALAEILREAGLDSFGTFADTVMPGASIHEMGGARMGTNPRTSVLNPQNQCWTVENLFVLDGACFVTGGYQNPTLTMMAIAGRASSLLANALRGSGI